MTAIRAQVSAGAVEGLRRMKPEEALPYAKAIQLGKHTAGFVGFIAVLVWAWLG